MADLNPDAFPTLTDAEMRTIGATEGVECRTYHDGDIVFRAGDADIDFFVVESGQIEILNPTNDNAHITMHEANTFVGDIDLITRRPVIVTAIARGETRVLVVPGDHFRHLLNTIPPLSEKLITAFTARRKLLQKASMAAAARSRP